MVLIIVLIALAALGGLACIPAAVAVRKGYDFAPWWAFGFLLFPLALSRARTLPDLSPVSASDYFSGAFEGYADLPAPSQQRPSEAPAVPPAGRAPSQEPPAAPAAPPPVAPRELERLSDDLPPWPDNVEARPASISPRPVAAPVAPKPAPPPAPEISAAPPRSFTAARPLRFAQAGMLHQAADEDREETAFQSLRRADRPAAAPQVETRRGSPATLLPPLDDRRPRIRSLDRPPRQAEASLRELSPVREGSDMPFHLAVRPDDRSLVFDEPSAPASREPKPSRRPGWRSAAAILGLMASLSAVWLLIPRQTPVQLGRNDVAPLPLREQTIESRPPPADVPEALPLDSAGVAALQRELIRLGYLYRGGDDGLPGPRTIDALERFRAERAPDLRADLDTRTLDRLRGAGR